jgi:hypothetical protein
MIYIGFKKTHHTVEILPSIRINMPQKRRNDVVVISWIIFEMVFGLND